jgi:hypothetical protein
MRALKAELPDEAVTPLPEDEFDAVLSYHDGDACAAVRNLLEDCRHLREQLALSQIGISIGFTRGWKPSFDRDAAE